MKALKEIPIYIVKKHNVKQIDVVQFDTGIQLVFTVHDFTIPSGSSATLYVQKPSGKFVFQEAGITITGNKITVNLENQAITEHGKIPYQVSITSGTDVVTTFTGLIMVERSMKDAGATESKTVIKAFDEAVSAHVAEFQTKAEQIVQACIATIPADYTAMVAKVNETANAVKGYLAGAVVRADDVSSVGHSPVVKAHGKNLFNYDAWKGVNAIHGEVTYSEDGVVKLTATENDCFTNYGMFPLAAIIPVKVGEAVTLSWETDAVEKRTSGLVYVFANGTADRFNSATATQKKLTYIPPLGCEFITFRLGVSVAGDSITYWNIQVEKGEAATAYAPYIDPPTVAVRRCGKNLVPALASGSSVESNGVLFKVNESGGITVSGTPTAISRFAIYGGVPIAKSGMITISLSGNFSNIVPDFQLQGKDGAIIKHIQTGQKATINLDEYPETASWNLAIKRSENGVAVGGSVYVQIEVGSVATPYEKGNKTAFYNPTADGTVPGITSLSPSMTILTDTEGVIVECEYNRDTNKVIEKLTNAIIALGGTI